MFQHGPGEHRAASGVRRPAEPGFAGRERATGACALYLTVMKPFMPMLRWGVQ